MTRDVYLGMRPDDLEDKPYARYWSPDMRGLSETVSQALLQSPFPASYGFAPRDCHALLEPGDLPLENGYTQLPSGEMFVAVNTPMPGASGDMIDWWFAWHGEESQRYKLWHPHAHMQARWLNPVQPEVPYDRSRYRSNTSLVDEFIGDQHQKLAIQFKPPAAFGLDESLFQDAGVHTAVCAEVGPAGAPFNFGRLVHLIRGTEDGCEMRSRFWLGKVSLRNKPDSHLANKLLGNRVLSRLAVSRALGHDMVVHCAMEMAHLASFLPALYQDYH